MSLHQKNRVQVDRHQAPRPGRLAESVHSLKVVRNDEPAREQAGWLDAAEPVQAFMVRYTEVIAPGWHPLARHTLAALLVAAKSNFERRQALNQMCVFGLTKSLDFVICSHTDTVVDGIVRKARMRSLGICEECSRPARVRELGEHEHATLCPRCAAPAMLQYDIWQLLQSLRFLRAVNVPVVASQIPPLLRPSFVKTASQHRNELEESGQIRMTPTRFLFWADEWRQTAEHIAVPRRHTHGVVNESNRDE